MFNKVDMEDIIHQSFTQYAGAVIQSRALVDVRDCIKPSARQIYYAMYNNKFTADKPFKKTLKAIGVAMNYYIHGDSSCEGIIMRSGQPFAMRYPLVEVEGSYGNLTETGNWAASRYTSSRLSKLSNYLLQETNKNIVKEWVDNYDDTEQYPFCLSSLGFYNIVNGSMGIATGIASSIPQFNLTEINQAMINLLKDKNYEINCLPDFATGGVLINPIEVRTSLKSGKGKACIIQSIIDYDEKDNALVVKEIPYGVYTNTICGEITKLVEKNENLGIININDLTGENVCIKIYLDKDVDPEHMIQYLYANTSLQKSIGINMTMLEGGKYPKVFSLREALLAHLEHEKSVYINMYEYEKEKIQYRLMIINGILSAINHIDEVVKIIKQAENVKEQLKNLLNINDEQVKAILDMKLGRLAKLEVDKYLQEKEKLETRLREVINILENEELLKNEIIKKLQEVIDKFGDERRTKIEERKAAKNTKSGSTQENIIEDVVVSLTNTGYLKNVPIKNYKVSKASNIINNIKTTTDDMLLLFSNKGKLYRVKVSSVKQCGNLDKGIALGSILQLDSQEKILAMTSAKEDNGCDYILFITALGKIKKTIIKDYMGTTQNLKGVKAINLKEDEIIDIFFVNAEEVYLITQNNYGIRFSSLDVSVQGPTASGVKSMTLSDDDRIIKSYLNDISLNKTLPLQKRGGKGRKL